MRILYISHSFGAWGSPDRVWDRNLRDSLIFQGHELLDPGYDQNQAQAECTLDPSGKARERYSELLYMNIKSLLESGPLDLILTYFDNRNILPEALDEIRQLGIPTVNFFCNAAHEFYKIDKVAAHFDYCIVPEKAAVELYRQVGATPVHLPMAANPRFYRPLNLDFEYQASFIGTKYLNREDHLLSMSKAGIDTHAFGALWPLQKPKSAGVKLRQFPRRIASILTWRARMHIRHYKGRQLPVKNYHGPVSDDEMIRIINQSKIVLGLSDAEDQCGKILRHVRLRDFEVPMCGAFYLTGCQEELSEYYEIGKEIVCFDSTKELVEKATYYLKHDHERTSIATAGYQRSIQQHTWEHRFKKLFVEIGLES